MKPSHWTQADLAGIGWTSIQCEASPHALCDTGRGLCFPLPEKSPGYNPLTAWGGLGCSRADDGRTLIASSDVYDVSSCDALDDGGDLVFCNGALAFARTDLSPWAYWSVCLLAVYIVRALSYLVLRRVERADAEDQGGAAPARLAEDDRTVAASACCVAVVLASGWGRAFVTQEEAVAAGATLVYVLAYMGTWACARWARADLADPPIYNLISGTLLLVATRLYAGTETPYNAALIWAIAARIGTKLRSRACVATLITTPLDALVLSLLCTLGFGFDPLLLVGILTASFAVGDMI